MECRHQCDCAAGASCDPGTGVCLCPPGSHGSRCQEGECSLHSVGGAVCHVLCSSPQPPYSLPSHHTLSCQVEASQWIGARQTCGANSASTRVYATTVPPVTASPGHVCAPQGTRDPPAARGVLRAHTAASVCRSVAASKRLPATTKQAPACVPRATREHTVRTVSATSAGICWTGLNSWV